MHAALVEVENISISDERTNASGYRRCHEDSESIVAVVLAQTFNSPAAIRLTLFEESRILQQLMQEKISHFKNFRNFFYYVPIKRVYN